MKGNLFIFYLLFWLSGRIYIFAPTYLSTKIYSGIGLHFDILCLLLYITHTTSYKDIKRKLFWAYFTIYQCFGMGVFTWYQLTGNHELKSKSWEACRSVKEYTHLQDFSIIEDLFIPSCVVFVAYQIYIKMTRYDSKNSAQINNEDIFLVLTYPKNIVGLFLCIFSPIKANSVCLYAQNYFYTYKKDCGYIKRIYKSEEDMNDYFFINTDIKYNQRKQDLERLVNKKWKINKTCLNTFQQIIGPLKQYI